MGERIRRSVERVKRPLRKVKHVRWLLPGWVFYEFYKVNKNKGETKSKSIRQGAKAEVIRLAAFASIPLPGTYELTTTGLALLKNQIEKGELENLTLKAFKDFTPIKRIKDKSNKIYFKIFYRNGEPYFRIFRRKK